MWDAINLKTGEVKIFRNAQYTSGKGTYSHVNKQAQKRANQVLSQALYAPKSDAQKQA